VSQRIQIEWGLRALCSAALLCLAATASAAPIQIATYPRDGEEYVPTNAELYFVFDQPTAKEGAFSVADLDSSTLPLLNLEQPRWSAAGDTVFLKPSQPMAYGHLHGMRVNLIRGLPLGSNDANDLPIVYFTTFPRAKLERVVGNERLESFTLVPDRPTEIGISVKETAGNAVTLTMATVELWAEEQVTAAGGPITDLPARTFTVPLFIQVARFGAARLEVPVTVPRDLARLSPDGRIGLRIVFEGTDETGLPIPPFEAVSYDVITTVGTARFMSPGILTPPIAGNVSVESAVLEWPLPGATLAAGDTLRPRAVVTGIGTGPFRAVFTLDGDVIGMEEGFMESGRPVTVEMRGPIPTKRFGERRLQFVVESPQDVAAAPITILLVPPAHGLTPDRTLTAPIPEPELEAPPARFTLESTWLAAAKSRFREESGSVTGWATWRAGYDLAPGRKLTATITSRVRFDDPENGTASPEQVNLRYTQDRASLEWGDLAPTLAAGAPLLAASVPRRAAQLALANAGLGEVQGYVALESHPRSAGGPAREIRADLYAGRLSRTFASDRLRASLYGGYTHEDPTAGGVETSVRTRAVYGGSARIRIAKSWSLLGDGASVRHRTIEGVEPGRTRTGVRGVLDGSAAGFNARAEGFRYQPDLATALNPYAISDRKGYSADLSRSVATWRFFGGFRHEEPASEASGAPSVTAERLTIGGSLRLGPDAWVTPSLIRIRQKGIQTDFTQTRVATEFSAPEAMGGRTTARFDVALFEDERGLNAKRLVTSGSVVSVRRHPGRMTSTISAGIEQDENQDLNLRDRTIQGAFELRWEAMPGRFLVTPFIAYTKRELNLRGTRQDRLSVRLQLSLLRLPSLGETALSVEGRYDKFLRQEPTGPENGVTAIELSLGRRIPILR